MYLSAPQNPGLSLYGLMPVSSTNLSVPKTTLPSTSLGDTGWGQLWVCTLQGVPGSLERLALWRGSPSTLGLPENSRLQTVGVPCWPLFLLVQGVNNWVLHSLQPPTSWSLLDLLSAHLWSHHRADPNSHAPGLGVAMKTTLVWSQLGRGSFEQSPGASYVPAPQRASRRPPLISSSGLLMEVYFFSIEKGATAQHGGVPL